jgi:hypothetical protein
MLQRFSERKINVAAELGVWLRQFLFSVEAYLKSKREF